MKLKTRVIAWWSGGISSALACWIALQIYKDVVIVFIDTHNEDDDTYRFLRDCENWYGQKIKTISSDKYDLIQEVWRDSLSLNVATGAKCSSTLKREVREQFQNLETDHAQIFGFDVNEIKRHQNMRRNYPELNVQSPLIDAGLTKAGIVREFIKFKIEIPRAYKMGYRNNNCFKTMCVQGGIGYWKKVEADFPIKFDMMANEEHHLTKLKGEPVFILKDRTEGRKGDPVFLKHNPDYPHIKDLSMMKGRDVESLVECTGFCSTKD